MSTSDLIYEDPRTQQSLATSVIFASKAPQEENRSRSSGSTHIPHLPKLVALLAERSILGPWHHREINLNSMGTYIASGGSFDIFEDTSGIVDQYVYRRVSAFVAR